MALPPGISVQALPPATRLGILVGVVRQAADDALRATVAPCAPATFPVIARIDGHTARAIIKHDQPLRPTTSVILRSLQAEGDIFRGDALGAHAVVRTPIPFPRVVQCLTRMRQYGCTSAALPEGK